MLLLRRPSPPTKRLRQLARKCCYLSRIVICCLFLQNGMRLVAQTVDRDLFYKSVAVDSVATPLTVSLDPPGPRRLDSTEIKQFFTDWLVYLQAARNNLLDDLLYLKRDYDLLWPGFYNEFLKEVDAAIGYCDSAALPPAFIFKHLPAPAAINAYLGTLSMTGLQVPAAGDNPQKWIVVSTDPFESWLHTWFSSQVTTAFPFSDMQITYIKEWRSLEDIFRQTFLVADTLTGLVQHHFDVKKFKELFGRVATWEGELDTSVVLKYLRSPGNFIQRSLWFTGGQLHMNPLITTDPKRLYPRKERNTFLPGDFFAMQDSLQQIKWARQLFRTQHVYNEILLPRYDPDRDKQTLYVQYDAHRAYAPDRPFANNGMRFKKDKLVAIIHNVPSDKTLTMTVTTNKSIPNESRAVTTLNEVLAPLGSAVKLFSPLAAVAGAVVAPFRPLINNTIAFPQTTFQQYDLQIAQNKFLTDTALQNMNKEVTRVKVITVNGHQVVLHDRPEDVNDILRAAFFPNDTDTLVEVLINTFTERYLSQQIDYAHPQRSADKLIREFRDHLFYQAATLVETLYETHNELLPVLRMYNRSLPSSGWDAYTDTAASYSTIIKSTALPDPTAKFAYSLSEAGDKGQADKEVAHASFRLAKIMRWNISAGIDYTAFKTYMATPTASSGVPDIQPANHLQFMAAFHYYLWGINNLNDGFLKPVKERISVFAGLGITKPLDNYYAGLGYDLVPGIKVMAGMHLYRQTRYKVINDQVSEKASRLDWMGPAFGVHLDYTTLGSILGFFK